MTTRLAFWIPTSVIIIALSVGVAIWAGIAADVTAEATNPSLSGTAVGRDFAGFRLAGQRVVAGDTHMLYDFDDETARGPSPFRNPPFYALLMVPFAAVGFIPGYLVWTGGGFLCLAAGLVLLGVRYPIAWTAGIVLTVAGLLNWFYGQNSFFTFLLLSASYASLKANRRVLGGSFIGMIAYKPQLLGGFAVWLIVRYSTMWRVIVGAALSGGLLIGISLVLIPATWPQFAAEVLTIGPDIANEQVHLTLRHTASLLLPHHAILAFILFVAAVTTVIVGQLWFIHKVENDLGFAFAAAVSVSILVAPRGLAYDWVLLAIPLSLVWTRLPDLWKTWLWLTASLVVAIPASILLAIWQMDELGVALQTAPLVLAIVLIIAGRSIVHEMPSGSAHPRPDTTMPQPTRMGAAHSSRDTVDPIDT